MFYGGEVKGESVMKYFDDIGTSVIHTFQVSFIHMKRQTDRHSLIQTDIHPTSKKLNKIKKSSTQINNDGPWRAPYVEVDIEWPHQVGNDKPQGKWLLYLEDRPIVEGAGGGECTVEERLINPLNIKIKEPVSSFIAPALREDPALLKTNKSRSFVEYREKISSMPQEKKTANDESILNRVRRDHSMIIRAEKLIDKDGKKTNIVSMVRLL